MISKIKRTYRKRIPVSKIMEQLWCERKMELKLLFKVKYRSKEMVAGERLHMMLSSRDNLLKPKNFIDWLGYQLYLSDTGLNGLKRRGYVREVFLTANIGGWYLTGSVDEIRLFGTRSQVVEVKTVKNRIPNSIHHKTQAMLYRRMLEEIMMQDYTENLINAYGLGRTECISSRFAEIAGIKERELFKISKSLAEKIAKVPKPADECRVVYITRSGRLLGEVWFSADDKQVNSILDFARSYWLGEREATKTKDYWKCKFCEVKHLCNQNVFI